MAIASVMNWYVRAGGAETNGGGYDGTTYPGGVNYADQDSPQLSLSDLTSSNSTTITSVTGGFTANMVGNVLRIASGTGATTGYYVIATYVDTNTITVDRVSGTYTAGVGKIGGAHAWINSYANGGGGTQPVLTTPLVAGNTIWLRGAGSTDPSNSSPDYTVANGTNYWTFPNGNINSGGPIKLYGYNGRPLIKFPNLIGYTTTGWVFSNLKLLPQNSPTYDSLGFWNNAGGAMDSKITDVIYDQNGTNGVFFNGGGVRITNCEARNTGGGTIGGYPGININSYGAYVENVWIHDFRGNGITIANADFLFNIRGCLITNNLAYGIQISNNNLSYGVSSIQNCTIDGNKLDGVRIAGPNALYGVILRNCNITNHSVSGSYGLYVSTDSATVNDALNIGNWDYNNFYGNDSNYHNVSAGAHDLNVDPQYTNTAGNDYSVGTNLKAKGFPLIPIGSTANPSSTQGYTDIGAVQRQESGGGGGATYTGFFIQ